MGDMHKEIIAIDSNGRANGITNETANVLPGNVTARCLPTIRWASGSCSRIGGKRINEDRYVAISDVTDNVGPTASKNPPTILGRAAATVTGQGIDPRETPLESTGALGFFAVYDVHDGEDAADQMSRSLHLRILG